MGFIMSEVIVFIHLFMHECWLFIVQTIETENVLTIFYV